MKLRLEERKRLRAERERLGLSVTDEKLDEILDVQEAEKKNKRRVSFVFCGV